MPSLSDQHYLKSEQYKDDSKLSKRMGLHQRFSTGTEGWFPWLWKRVDLEPGARVLEVGCGPGTLWASLHGNLPEGVWASLGDLSIGMARTARQALEGLPGFRFSVYDAQHLPFSDEQFDLVIANHMLYHVPDIDGAVAEFARVLKPGGRLVAATNGQTHMRELMDLVIQSGAGADFHVEQSWRFSLENAAQILGRSFSQVEVLRHENDLLVTELQPLLDYLQSTSAWYRGVQPEDWSRVLAFVAEQFEASGRVFHIRKAAGAAIARKAV